MRARGLRQADLLMRVRRQEHFHRPDPEPPRSVLKNNRGLTMRFTATTAICDPLDTTPGDRFTID